jgi:uncharacterized protein YegP (UPF0339 family)
MERLSKSHSHTELDVQPIKPNISTALLSQRRNVMPGKFELKKSPSGQFMFNLKASNGQVILTSEQYVDKRGAEGGIA